MDGRDDLKGRPTTSAKIADDEQVGDQDDD